MTYGSESNPNTVKIGKVSIDKDSNAFRSQQHTFGYHTTETGKYSYLDNVTDEAALRSINSALFQMGAKIKLNISEIVTPAVYEIPARITFISHARNLEAPDELIADLWCISLNRSLATLGATTQKGVRSSVLPLARRYRAYIYFQHKTAQCAFNDRHFFWDIR